MASVIDLKNLSAIEDEIRSFYDLIKGKYPIRKMILFGSYVRGCATSDSDIDVGVVINYPKGSDRIEITADLFHYSRTIDTLIEPFCILWDDYLHSDPASILAEIIRTGIEVVSVPEEDVAEERS